MQSSNSNNDPSEVNNLLSVIEESISRVEKEMDPESMDENDNNTSTTESVDEHLIECLSIGDSHIAPINDINLRTESVNYPVLNNNYSNSSVELTELKEDSCIEIAELESPNILNICSNSRKEIRNSKEETNYEDNRRPVIEVLSNCDSNDRPEIEELNDSMKDSKAINRCEEDIVENITLDEATGDSMGGDDIGIRPLPVSKSSAITFFCENLDELKHTESDSYESLEEI